MTITMEEPAPTLAEAMDLWRRVGDVLIGGQFRIECRLDAMDQRFDGVDQRLDGIDRRLDTMNRRFDAMDQRFDGFEASTNQRFVLEQRLDRSDLANQRRFDRLDAKIEQLIGLVQHSELKDS